MPVLCVSTYWYRHNGHLQMIGLWDVCPFFQVDHHHRGSALAPSSWQRALNTPRPGMVTAAQDIRATARAAGRARLAVSLSLVNLKVITGCT